jgi:Family of unknown function (DUF5706)
MTTAEPFDRRAMLEANLHRQVESIRASDGKIQLLVPTTTAMIGVLAALLRGPSPATLKAIYALVGALPLVVALAFMAMTVIPRMRSGSPSLLFFGGIAGRDRAAFRREVLALGPDAYLADLADQCHATAGIARAKYRQVRNAYIAFFVALPSWALAIHLLNRG